MYWIILKHVTISFYAEGCVFGCVGCSIINFIENLLPGPLYEDSLVVCVGIYINMLLSSFMLKCAC